MGKRSVKLSTAYFRKLWFLISKSGEPVGIRTRDLLIKSQLLYQLSYRPITGRLFRKPA
jgi:hypothetical protein